MCVWGWVEGSVCVCGGGWRVVCVCMWWWVEGSVCVCVCGGGWRVVCVCVYLFRAKLSLF